MSGKMSSIVVLPVKPRYPVKNVGYLEVNAEDKLLIVHDDKGNSKVVSVSGLLLTSSFVSNLINVRIRAYGAFIYKGKVSTLSRLPTTAKNGDVYQVRDKLYVFNNNLWILLGPDTSQFLSLSGGIISGAVDVQNITLNGAGLNAANGLVKLNNNNKIPDELVDAGKVKINELDSADYLMNKFSNTSSIYFTNNTSALFANINSNFFKSIDNSVIFNSDLNQLNLSVPNLGKVKISLSDSFDYLFNKIKSNDNSIFIDNNTTYLNIKVASTLITSDNNTVKINYNNGAFNLSVTEAGKIKINLNDSLTYFADKIQNLNNPIIINYTDSYINVIALSTLMLSLDNSIDILYNNGKFNLQTINTGKVKVSETDNLDYLNTKFSNSDDSIILNSNNNIIDFKVASGLILSNNNNMNVNYNNGKFIITDYGKVKVSLNDTFSYLNNKFNAVDNSLIIDSTDSLINFKVTSDLVSSLTDNINISYNNGKFTITDYGKVKVSLNDTFSYLNNKFNASDNSIIIDSTDFLINFKVASDLVSSLTDNINVNYDNGKFTITDYGKVKVSLNDTFSYLNNKFNASDDSIIIDSTDSLINFKVTSDLVSSLTDNINVNYDNGKFTITDYGKVKVSLNDTFSYLNNKFNASDDSIIIDSTNSLINFKVTSDLISSLTDNMNVNYNNGKFIIIDSGKVKVSLNDTFSYLNNKFKAFDDSIIINSTDSLIDFKVASGLILSNDNNINVNYNNGKFIITDFGKVKVSLNDTFSYLNNKFNASDNSIIIDSTDFLINFKVASDLVSSLTDNINVNYDNGKFTITDYGKVKVSLNDTFSYLNNKFNASDDSIIIDSTDSLINFKVTSDLVSSLTENMNVNYDNGKFTITDYGKVKVSLNDTFSYLNNKFKAFDNSIIINSTDSLINFKVTSDLVSSLTDNINISYDNSKFIITDYGKVKVSLSDTFSYLNNKFKAFDDSIIIDSTDSLINFKVTSDLVSSLTDNLNINYDNGKFIITDFGKVKVSLNDTFSYLNNKFKAFDNSIIINSTDSLINFKVASGLILSNDNNINISYDNGKFTITDYGKVKVSLRDTFSYLNNKFKAFDDSIIIDSTDSLINFKVNSDLVSSLTDNINVNYNNGKFTIIDYGKVKVSLRDTFSYLNNKFKAFDDSIIINSTDSLINFKISNNLIKSTTSSINIDYENGQFNLNTIETGKVKVSLNDSLSYLNTKLKNTDSSIVITVNNSDIDFSIVSDLIKSTNNTINISHINGKFDLSTIETGKIKISLLDNLGYLNSKIKSETTALTINTLSNSDIKFNITSGLITSKNTLIKVDYNTGKFNLTALLTGKIKVTLADNLDYLSSKINVDSSISELITIEKTTNSINIKSALTNSGILKVENGKVKLFTPPTSGSFALTSNNGTLAWTEISECN